MSPMKCEHWKKVVRCFLLSNGHTDWLSEVFHQKILLLFKPFDCVYFYATLRSKRKQNRTEK